ncbi:hypothetical protein F4804DRAFT_353254 [Jackrogersella minutella]|nr:hypothetical protein F4804DRAFT_353254 [Jackrogersella minutella]
MSEVFKPPWFVAVRPNKLEMNLSSIVAGVSIATGIFSFAKALLQTRSICRKKKRPNTYVVLIWIEWSVCITMGFICWFYLWGSIEPSFTFFFLLVSLWVFQTQCLIQIIINRIALMMEDQSQVVKVKWGVGIVFGLVNLSVYLIWIPARLQINDTYIRVNDIWDRIEKGIFCLIDCVLNIYFIYVVRSGLISNGLTKYMPLFIFNIIMLTFSLSLDVILIGVMSLGQIYFQFHPFVYLLKLYIEMNMTDLIAKIVRADNALSYSGDPERGWHSESYAHGTTLNSNCTRSSTCDPRVATLTRNDTDTTYRELDNLFNRDDSHVKSHHADNLQRTMVTEIRHSGKSDRHDSDRRDSDRHDSDRHDSTASQWSSNSRLSRHYSIS